MRRILSLLPFLLLIACQKDFDERYAETEKQLKAEAGQLDKDMAKEAKKEPSEAK
jgi:hypothetical protein